MTDKVTLVKAKKAVTNKVELFTLKFYLWLE
jgi:hypothetical protein